MGMMHNGQWLHCMGGHLSSDSHVYTIVQSGVIADDLWHGLVLCGALCTWNEFRV